jgi:hypothetical protein
MTFILTGGERTMRDLNAKRFGAHEVEEGESKSNLHVATESYRDFHGELCYLHMYLQSRVLPTEPEEVLVRGIILDLQNVLEYECERLMKHHVECNPTHCNRKFDERLRDGYLSFKAKVEWLKARHLLGSEERDVMEEVRILRNALIHTRPEEIRPRYRYFGKPLLSQGAVRQLFADVEAVLQKLRFQSKTESGWKIVPPGYASEMQWPAKAVAVFDGE